MSQSKMTEDMRAAIRDAIHAEVKQVIENLGGDVSDACAIFSVAFVETHVSIAVMGNVPMEVARDQMIKVLSDGYPLSYANAQAYVRNGMVAGASRH